MLGVLGEVTELVTESVKALSANFSDVFLGFSILSLLDILNVRGAWSTFAVSRNLDREFKLVVGVNGSFDTDLGLRCERTGGKARPSGVPRNASRSMDARDSESAERASC